MEDAVFRLIIVVLISLFLEGYTRADNDATWDLGVGFTSIDFPHYIGSRERTTLSLPFPYISYLTTVNISMWTATHSTARSTNAAG